MNRERRVKEVFICLVLPLLTIGGLIMIFISNKSDNKEVDLEDAEVITSVYKNEGEGVVKVRYKYILGHEVSNHELLESIDLNEPLFSLISDDSTIAEEYIYLGNKKDSLPVVSDTINLDSEEKLEKKFIISYRNDIEDIRYNIRFEVNIVVEELIKGKWTPVYQVIFMERGPYWSLDKGPIERLEDKTEENYYE